MNINWKVRCKSKAFWMAVISAALVFVYALLRLFGLELPVAQEAVMNVFSLALTFLAAIGIINDPTTPGLKDSARAQGYSVPGGTHDEQDPASGSLH